MKTLALVSAASLLLLASPAFATGKHTPTPPPVPTGTVNNYSPHNDVNTSANAAAVAAANAAANSFSKANSVATGGVGIGKGGSAFSQSQGGAGGGGGAGGNASAQGGRGGRATSSSGGNSQSTVVNANSYQARQRLQAPGIAASFSSVAGNPCERAPLGLGASLPGLGGLFQIPLESDRCWGERGVNQGLLLRQQGLPISDNAIVAIYAGVPARQAILDNPYVGRSAYRVRTHRAKKAGCGCR